MRDTIHCLQIYEVLYGICFLKTEVYNKCIFVHHFCAMHSVYLEGKNLIRKTKKKI